MGRKKLIREIKNALNEEFNKGYDAGYEAGKNSQDLDSSYGLGWKERFDNVKLRLEGLMDTYMTTRKFRDAQTVKEIIEYLDIFVEPYDEEKYQQQLRNEGF